MFHLLSRGLSTRASSRPSDIAVDLGTSKIAVYVRGEGVVLEEPACLAFRGTPDRLGAVIAVGHEAARMFGKTPQGAFVVQPIQDGVISDCRMAGLLLKALMDKYQIGAGLGRRRFLVGTLFGATSMERRSFEQVALAAGAKDVVLVAEPLAAAVGAGLPIDEPRANMVVDVGGGATEALVVSMKRVVSGGSIRVGGDAMNDAIRHALHRGFGLDVGIHEARRLKEAVSGAVGPAMPLTARGLDARVRRPRAASLQVRDVREALTGPCNAIVEMVQSVVDGLPAELSADLVDRGIILTGGGAATQALQMRIEAATGVTVRSLASPQQAVIQGCGRMLDYLDLLAS